MYTIADTLACRMNKRLGRGGGGAEAVIPTEDLFCACSVAMVNSNLLFSESH